MFSVVGPTSVSGMIEVKSEGCIILTDHRKSWLQAEGTIFNTGSILKFLLSVCGQKYQIASFNMVHSRFVD